MPGLMQKGKDSVVGTIIAALAVCLVCSVVVSFAAISLRPVQDNNKTVDRKRNILSVVGMLDPSQPVEQQFGQFETRVIDFETGEYAPDMNTEEFDQRKSSKDPELSINLTAEQDLADIKRREQFGQVYLVRNDDDSIRFMVLPVRGYGLWSTLYGFLALEGDGKTIVGLSFYEHAETPGRGGEVDNPKWKAQWRGKKAYDEQWEPRATVIKGTVDPSRDDSQYQVDGLSGATLTSRGVANLIHFWLSEDGYKPFIQRVADA